MSQPIPRFSLRCRADMPSGFRRTNAREEGQSGTAMLAAIHYGRSCVQGTPYAWGSYRATACIRRRPSSRVATRGGCASTTTATLNSTGFGRVPHSFQWKGWGARLDSHVAAQGSPKKKIVRYALFPVCAPLCETLVEFRLGAGLRLWGLVDHLPGR